MLSIALKRLPVTLETYKLYIYTRNVRVNLEQDNAFYTLVKDLKG